MQATVLLLIAAVALCGANDHVVEVACEGERHAENAVHFAVDHINDHHFHGYEFNLTELTSHKVETHGTDCDITLVFSLQETKCHFSNPKQYEDCEYRERSQTLVTANCEVVLHVRTTGTVVHSQKCETHKDANLLTMCPDCPTLLPLNHTEGLKAVHRAIAEYNLNNATEHYFVLYDVGRLMAQFIMGEDMHINAEFALVESHCPVGSRIMISACRPLCPDRARHVFCRSRSDANTTESLDCETYPEANNAKLAAGEKEPICAEYQHGEMPSKTRLNLAEEEPTAAAHFHKFVCTEKEEEPAVHTICDWPPIEFH